MIDKLEIENKAEELGIHIANVQRDYVFGWLLAGLYHSNNPLNKDIILKGGNCFRKTYFEHTRFSNDLDFSTRTELNEERLKSGIRFACEFAMENSGVKFLIAQNRIINRSAVQQDSVFYDARVYFKSFYGDEDITIKVELDIKEFDRILLPVQIRNLIHSYSDQELCIAKISCWKLEELLASKLKALLHRQHSPDLYDFVFSLFFQNVLKINRTEVISTFLKKTIYERSPHLAKKLFLELPFQIIRGLWNEFLVCPKFSLIKFEDAENRFRTVIDELFALLTPTPAFAPVSGSRMSPSYFASNKRNLIFEAGRLRKLLRIVYDGFARIVEPYSLAFKRRQDGIALEYFYAWDRSGGKSGHTGIKSFISDKVQSIQITNESFEPRFPIELVKGPGYFAKPFSSSPRPLKTKARRSASFSTGTTYTVQCTICGKKFKRNKFDLKLNEHKDKYGNRCLGRYGILVYN